MSLPPPGGNSPPRGGYHEQNYSAEDASMKYILFNISVKEKYILLTKKTW